MKSLFVCEECGKQFKTEKEALECEKKHAEEKERKANLKKQKESRKSEISAKYKELIELIKVYNEDYNEPAEVPYTGALSRLLDTMFDTAFRF